MLHCCAVQVDTTGNALLAQLHAERAARAAHDVAGRPFTAPTAEAGASSSSRAAAPAQAPAGVAAPGAGPPAISLLTYNVWWVPMLCQLSCAAGSISSFGFCCPSSAAQRCP